VGIGDGIGYINKTLVQSFVRSDGRILGPGRSATPVDAMFGSQAPSGEIWQASTTIGGSAWVFVLAVDVTKQYALNPASLYPHLHGIYFSFTSLLAPACANGSAASSCVDRLASASLLLQTGPMIGPEHSFSLHTLAPVSPAG
jgi:hypothetical protein